MSGDQLRIAIVFVALAIGAAVLCRDNTSVSTNEIELDDGSTLAPNKYVPVFANIDARTKYRAGNKLIEKGDFAGGERHIREAAKLAPDNAAIIHQLGFSQYIQLNLDEAKTNFALAIELDPLYVPAHVGLGSVAAHFKDYEAAAAHHLHAITIDPSFPLAHWGAGRSLWNIGKSDEAVTHLKIFVEMRPNSKFASIAARLIEEFESGGE